MSALTGKQRRHLRALGHEQKVLVQIGKGGIDAGLIAAVDQALTYHELVKVRLGEASGLDRHEAAIEIAAKTKSEIAQVLGKIFLLFRSHPEHPQITLP
jgi:RNA-binding protein